MKLSKSMKVFLSAMFVTLPLMLISPDAYALPKTFVGTPSQVTAELVNHPAVIKGTVVSIARSKSEGGGIIGKLSDGFSSIYFFISDSKNYARINAARNLLISAAKTGELVKIEGDIDRTVEGPLVLRVEDAGRAQ